MSNNPWNPKNKILGSDTETQRSRPEPNPEHWLGQHLISICGRRRMATLPINRKQQQQQTTDYINKTNKKHRKKERKQQQQQQTQTSTTQKGGYWMKITCSGGFYTPLGGAGTWLMLSTCSLKRCKLLNKQHQTSTFKRQPLAIISCLFH